MTEVLATIEGVAGPGRIGRVAIGDVLRRSAIRFPERIAIVEGARRTSFAELDAASNRLANYFLSRGLRRGDKVATIGQNSTEYVVATFAIHKAGLVWVPINAMLGADDMRFILGHAGVSLAAIDGAILADATRREILDGPAASTPTTSRRVSCAILAANMPVPHPRSSVDEQPAARFLQYSKSSPHSFSMS
ncbi:long-chain acyl-CoA synthetase [Rhizobiales bacterium GAS191]|nr:long-chain acyl-CoA synthetase [Rhizobiales bacterium GAS191]